MLVQDMWVEWSMEECSTHSVVHWHCKHHHQIQSIYDSFLVGSAKEIHLIHSFEVPQLHLIPLLSLDHTNNWYHLVTWLSELWYHDTFCSQYRQIFVHRSILLSEEHQCNLHQVQRRDDWYDRWSNQSMQRYQMGGSVGQCDLLRYYHCNDVLSWEFRRHVADMSADTTDVVIFGTTGKMSRHRSIIVGEIHVGSCNTVPLLTKISNPLHPYLQRRH